MENSIVQHRRGTTADWEQYKDVVLKEGEISVEFCEDGTALLKVGNGVDTYENLQDVGVSREKIEQIIADNDNTEEITEAYQKADAELKELYRELSINTKALETNILALEETMDEKIEELVRDNPGANGLEYIENILYLKSGDSVISSVEIVGGTGGGGSSSYIDYDLTSNMESTVLTVGKNAPCLIDFNFFSIKMPQERPTGKFTAEVVISNVVKASYSLEQGNNQIDIQDALNTGDNAVQLRCYDVYGNTLSLNFTIKVIELVVTSIFDDTEIQQKEIIFKYTPFGLLDKTVHIYVDNEEVYTESITSSGQQQTVTLPKQKHGEHDLKIFTTAVVSSVDVVSNILEYSFISVEDQNPTCVISSLFTRKEVKQGDQISIPYLVYDPLSPIADIKLTINRVLETTKELYKEQELTVSRQKQYWNTREFPVGVTEFVVSCRDTVKSFTVEVSESDLKVEAVDNDLQLFLSAAGRSNDEKNVEEWKFNSVTTTFENFNWKSNGWVEDDNNSTCLRLNGDARAFINFEPFKEEIKTYGKTIEFEFAVRDVNNRDTIVMSCMSGGIGFEVSPDTATLKTEGSTLSCNYKEDTRVRVGFTIERAADKTRFISIYLDGVLSGVSQYSDTTNLQQSSPVGISIGSSLCGIDLYSIRVYSTALSPKQMLQNYVADTEDFAMKSKIHDDNDIYDSYTGLLSYSKLKKKIPTITFIGKMPTYKGDKKKNSVRMIFEHPTQPELNFDEILKQIDVQGTSSAGYVRKNWKTKHSVEHQHMKEELPAEVFCIKVDYAEGTGTHNTQNANFVETLYSKPVLPQLDEERVRTTITGFPVVIFHLDTDDKNLIDNITTDELAQRTDVVFSSKGNFNYDKDAENAFGFTEDYDTECWEFCNNTSDSVRFLNNIPEDYASDFEARYHPDLGDLEDLEDADVKDEAAIKSLRDSMIQRFKTMHDWVVSTNKSKATNNALEEEYTDNVGNKFTHDTSEYRLAKFRTEFTDYFDSHYVAVYYVYTFFALMVDQRAKNFFLTYWHDIDDSGNVLETGKWYPYFYDNDTSYGINNEGQKVFDYFHEDSDIVDGKAVYNGADSVLWCNFRECFTKLIRDTYAELRSSGKLTESKLISQVVEKGSDMWSASVYNEDAEYKYISLARPDYDANNDGKPDTTSTYLYQVTGNGEHHFRYFVSNRLRYCDSKWYAGDYFADQIYLRIYTPKLAEYKEGMTDEEKAEIDAKNILTQKSIEGVPACGDISITPYSDVYAGVRYKAVSGDDITLNLQQQRASRGSTVTFHAPLNSDTGKQEEFNDTETYIYGASDISSLGDLSPLYCGYIDVSHATKLTHLKIGNSHADYQNLNLHTLSVGSNQLLKTIDITNCSGLKSELDVSKCSNIEEIYAKGSSITSVVLPQSGYVRIMHLPSTITNLTIQNQLYIEELDFEGYNNLTTLCIDNCPSIDATDILNKCNSLQRLRLTNVDWEFDNLDFLKSLETVRGIDENNSNTDHAYLSGKCKISHLTGEDMAYIRSHYPYLEVLFENLSFTVTYMDEAGKNVLYQYPITLENGSSKDAITIIDPVETGNIKTIPSKESTISTVYSFGGWSTQPNSEPQDYCLSNIISDVTRYVAFNSKVRQYTVSFYNNDVLLKQVSVDYSTSADYGDTSDIVVTGTKIPYVFDHWAPEPINVGADISCYAEFKLDETQVTTCSTEDLVLSNINENDSTVYVTGYKGTSTVLRIPEHVEINNKDYTIISIDGFSRSDLIYIQLPQTLLRIEASCFEECLDLEQISIPNSVITVGAAAFRNCSRLSDIKLPSGITVLSDHVLQGCTSLKYVEIPESVTTMRLMCLYRSGLEYVIIPPSVKTIAQYVLRYCESLSRVDILSTKCSIENSILSETPSGLILNVAWSEGEVQNIPWGAKNPTINYNVVF